MRIDGLFLKAFVVLARVMGVIWILGGVYALISSVVVPEFRLLSAGMGILLLIAGAAFIVAKPPTDKDLQRFRSWTGKG